MEMPSEGYISETQKDEKQVPSILPRPVYKNGLTNQSAMINSDCPMGNVGLDQSACQNKPIDLNRLLYHSRSSQLNYVTAFSTALKADRPIHESVARIHYYPPPSFMPPQPLRMPESSIWSQAAQGSLRPPPVYPKTVLHRPPSWGNITHHGGKAALSKHLNMQGVPQHGGSYAVAMSRKHNESLMDLGQQKAYDFALFSRSPPIKIQRPSVPPTIPMAPIPLHIPCIQPPISSSNKGRTLRELTEIFMKVESCYRSANANEAPLRNLVKWSPFSLADTEMKVADSVLIILKFSRIYKPIKLTNGDLVRGGAKPIFHSTAATTVVPLLLRIIGVRSLAWTSQRTVYCRDDAECKVFDSCEPAPCGTDAEDSRWLLPVWRFFAHRDSQSARPIAHYLLSFLDDTTFCLLRATHSVVRGWLDLWYEDFHVFQVSQLSETPDWRHSKGGLDQLTSRLPLQRIDWRRELMAYRQDLRGKRPSAMPAGLYRSIQATFRPDGPFSIYRSVEKPKKIKRGDNSDSSLASSATSSPLKNCVQPRRQGQDKYQGEIDCFTNLAEHVSGYLSGSSAYKDVFTTYPSKDDDDTAVDELFSPESSSAIIAGRIFLQWSKAVTCRKEIFRAQLLELNLIHMRIHETEAALGFKLSKSREVLNYTEEEGSRLKESCAQMSRLWDSESTMFATTGIGLSNDAQMCCRMVTAALTKGRLFDPQQLFSQYYKHSQRYSRAGCGSLPFYERPDLTSGALRILARSSKDTAASQITGSLIELRTGRRCCRRGLTSGSTCDPLTANSRASGTTFGTENAASSADCSSTMYCAPAPPDEADMCFASRSERWNSNQSESMEVLLDLGPVDRFFALKTSHRMSHVGVKNVLRRELEQERALDLSSNSLEESIELLWRGFMEDVDTGMSEVRGGGQGEKNNSYLSIIALQNRLDMEVLCQLATVSRYYHQLTEAKEKNNNPLAETVSNHTKSLQRLVKERMFVVHLLTLMHRVRAVLRIERPTISNGQLIIPVLGRGKLP